MKETKIKINKREALNPRDTYDPTTPEAQVVARPTDSYVQPEKDTSGLQFMEAVKNINQGLTTYSDMQRSLTRENILEAKADYQSGRYNKPSGIFNLGLGYDETWFHLKGESDAIEFKTEYDRLHKEARFFQDLETREEVEAARTKLFNETWQKYFGAEQNKYVLAGSYATVEKARIDNIVLGETAFAENKVERGRSYVSNILKGEILTGLDANLTPQDMNNKLDAFYNTIKSTFGVILTHDEFSSMRIDQTGGIIIDAIRNPSVPIEKAKDMAVKLLAALKVPQKDNVALEDIVSVDRDGNSVYKFRAKIHQIEKVIDAEMEHRKNIDKQKLGNSFMYDLSNISTESEAQAFKQRLADPMIQDKMDIGVYHSLLNHAQSIIDSGGKIRMHSDVAILDDMMKKLLKKELTLSDVARNMKNLSVADQRYFHAQIDSDIKHAEAMKKQIDRFDQIQFSALYNSFLSLYKTDVTGKFTGAVQMANEQFWREVMDYQQKNNMAWPVSDEFTKIRERVQKNNPLAFYTVEDMKNAQQGQEQPHPEQKKPKVTGVTPSGGEKAKRPIPSDALPMRYNSNSGRYEPLSGGGQ